MKIVDLTRNLFQGAQGKISFMLFSQIHKFRFCIQISIFLITLPFLHSKVGEVDDNSLKIQSEKISGTLIFLCANKIEKNRTDSSIQPLLKIAYCLSPDETNTFLIQGLIEKGKKIPEKLKSIKIDEGKFLQSLIQFTSKLKTNNRSLILWNLVQTLSPNNPTAAIALQSVKRKGISVDLENLIERKSQKIPDSVVLPLYKPELPEELRNKIVNEILIIDNYAKYKFLPKEKIWSPLERGNSTFLR